MYKGETVIELCSVKTGETEVFEHTNIVTNAVPDFLKYNPFGMHYYFSGSKAQLHQEMFPLDTYAYGGILLFEAPLEEDINRYIPPTMNPITGYASRDVNSTSNTKRGSRNLSESQRLQNGYKYVWDFTTSQANGRISALALTHYRGGLGYYGDSFSSSDSQLMVSTHTMPANFEHAAYYLGMVEANVWKNTIVSIIPQANREIDIVTFNEPLTSLGLNDGLYFFSPQTVDKKTLTLSEEFYPDSRNMSSVGFHDGKDGYWYGFNCLNNSRNHSVDFRRVRIKKSDYSSTYSQWQLDGIQLQIMGSYSLHYNASSSRSVYTLLDNHYLYAMHTNNSKLYKINIHNPVDIVEIDLGFTSNFTRMSSTNLYLYKWGNFIRGYDFLINENDEVSRIAHSSMQNIKTPLIELGPYRLGFGTTSSYSSNNFHKFAYLHTPYLGTINNLPTPILKTADKTMKITYTLTEVEARN